MHILVTVNSTWNLVNFRLGLLTALLADAYQITVLAPEDAQSRKLKNMGCRVISLKMDNKGFSPFLKINNNANLYHRI